MEMGKIGLGGWLGGWCLLGKPENPSYISNPPYRKAECVDAYLESRYCKNGHKKILGTREKLG